MKLLLLSDANSIHTRKWAKSLKQRGFNIKLFTLFKPDKDIIEDYKDHKINVVYADMKPKVRNLRNPNFSKIKYLISLPKLIKIIKSFNPDVIHAHYASSYGLLGALSGFQPLIISAWGSDIYLFPHKSKLNSTILKYILKKADIVCSTSKAMKKIIQNKYMRNDVHLVPFGIDTKHFKPKKTKMNPFTVGTIKSIEIHNGIDCLIEAANILINHRNKDINFIIVGDGAIKREMEKKSEELKLENRVKFIGYISHEKVIEYYEKLSIFIAVSTRESFGVSVLEAAACGLPSITSNVGGLIEVNSNNKTGLVISANDPLSLADSIDALYTNETLRLKLGLNARRRVKSLFEWTKNVDQMIKIYEDCKNEKY